MNKLGQQLRNIAVGLVASSCAMSFIMPSANATPKGGLTITIAGVQIHNGFKSNGAQTTFLSSDPAFGDNLTYELQPAIRTQLQTPFVGVNFQSLGSGNLNIGTFDFFEYFYQVPNSGPNADSGLRYFAQTADGFIHTATSTSTLDDSGNGFNEYNPLLFADQFSPSLTNSNINTLNIRYAGSHAGTIFFLAPFIAGSTNFVDGTFNFNTLNDSHFNN